MLDEAVQKEIIQKGTRLSQKPAGRDPYEEAFESDQDRKLPQPPLVKTPMAEEGERIALTRDFSGLALKNDLVSLIRDRRSARIYTNETMTLDELVPFAGRRRASRRSAARRMRPSAPCRAAARAMSLKRI